VAAVSLKTQLLDLLREAHTAHHAFIDSLTEAERTTAGTPERWAAKDIVAHLTSWQEHQGQRLAAMARGETPTSSDDYESFNQKTFEARRYRSWQEVIAELDRAFDTLIAHVQNLTDADLSDPQKAAWMHGRPLWVPLAGDTYLHPQAHFADFYLKRGDLPRATQMQEAMVERMARFGDAKAHGMALYNLACFYATSGQPTKALAILPEALRLDPSQVEWSKQDPDLVSLHEEPAYKGLYTT
jgi:tetratricopeptide (TPR) repeat protein